MPDVSWKIRKYKRGDEAGILALARNAFGKELLPEKNLTEFWNWEFRQNPIGDSKIWVADDHGKIVGHYAILPERFTVNGTEHILGLVVDVMTHSEYRYQGMFTRLGRAALEGAGNEGIPFCTGFPMEGSTASIVLPGHFKVGWFVGFTIPVLIRPINFGAIIQSFLKNPKLSKIGRLITHLYDRVQSIRARLSSNEIDFKSATSFSKEITEFWNEVSQDYGIIGVRDRRYLDYRFSSVPGRAYHILIAMRKSRIVGYMVLREMRRMELDFGLIVDVLTQRNDGYTRRVLFKKAVEYFKQRSVDLVGCMIQSKEYQRDLKALGFLTSPEKYYFIVHLNTGQFDRKTVSAKMRWFLTWADLDTI